MESLIAGTIIGLMGSLHCAVMCGPIALALPVRRSGFWLGHISHQLGKLTTYVLLGALVGALGAGLSLAGWQQPLSILVGVMLLLGLISKSPTLMKWGPYRRLYTKMQLTFARKLKDGKPHHFFMTGIINGLLPCGLVYAALLGALGSGTMINGIVFMAGFGLGTGPVLLIIAGSGSYIINALKGRVRYAIPLVVGVMSIFFILRGLGLSIPYVSPGDEMLKTEMVNGEAPSCH
ncbi:MAG: sulfite exporter TauE/SafE family protein [Flavobacteriia bacterium]|nr:sulfite exporter TauE/SafE family protein [Flavobacteriia bacterium]